MKRFGARRWMAIIALVTLVVLVSGTRPEGRFGNSDGTQGEPIPTGVRITPTAAEGSSFDSLNPDVADDPTFTADHAMSSAVSPNGATLLVLTSGYNSQNEPSGANQGQLDPNLQNEYVFVFDISHTWLCFQRRRSR